MLFGSINDPNGGAKPVAVQMSGITGECRFFLGDHWIHVGNSHLVMTNHGPMLQLPDLDQFVQERQHLDDGTDIWMSWGPTVN